MRKFLSVLLSGCVFVGALALTAQKVRERDLPEQYRDWLKLVSYIILPVERDVFLKLSTDRDRSIFIETFWKQRDPTPGTPANEYKDEIVKRFAYVNKNFRRQTVREGWQTDMGRIYMILGPPTSIERWEVSAQILPCQAWTYYGDPKKELPSLFNLLFFQKGGVGEYKLYDPSADGPAELLTNKRDVDPTDYESAYEKIKEIAPTLADVSLTMIPGEYHYGYAPSPRNTIILADILESPTKDINPSYATHFMDYKGIVSTEYMTNYVDSETRLALIQDPMMGINFLHFSIVPKSLSVDYYDPKSQYFCSLRLDESLRLKEDVVFQYTRDFPLYFPESEVGRITANGIALEDSFPIAEGTYKLIILLQNSVGKEFSIFEKEVTVPVTTGLPRIAGPFIGYKIENYQKEIHIPFKMADKKIVVDPKNTLSGADDLAFLFSVADLTEDLRARGEVKIAIKGLRENNPAQKSLSLRLASYPFGRVLTLAQSIPAKEFDPDYYELKLTLVDGDGKPIDEKAENFIVSPEAAVSHPIAHAKGFPVSNQYLYLYMLAGQYDKTNEDAKAKETFEKAFGLNPDFKEGIEKYASYLIKVKDFDRVIELAQVLRSDDRKKFESYLFEGQAHMGKGDYGRAIQSFLEGNKIYNSDTGLLNALGRCYQMTGRKDEALNALKASLRLDPSQEEIKKLVNSLER